LRRDVRFRPTKGSDLGRHLCECDDPAYTAIVQLTIPEHEAVRSKPRQFVVIPDRDASPDEVVEAHDPRA
jgi:hypothetical protein